MKDNSGQGPKRKLSITEVVLRDGHQSLLATRMRLDDMLPIAGELDKIGYWSAESWGGATFDACLRFLGEDPWERIREISKAMPNTPQQMLLRGQNILGYRHYANDVVEKFVERCVKNGVTVFRVFDALNDMRNIETAIKAVIKHGGHAQGTLSYTISPVHTPEAWLKQAKDIESLGAHSLAIKDMSGLLTPYTAYDLVSRIKQQTSLRVHLHCHATTGLSTATAVKAVEAGADTIDTSISTMSMTYGHSATEALVAIFKDTPYDTGLDMDQLIKISAYFRKVRRKYAKFEGAMQGVDPRILVAQVPGGMLTNMENQLREQKMSAKLDEVLQEIPKVRKDLGYVPLVTPSSQIVGAQAVMNVMTGERYKTITKETEGIVKGEYGKTPAPVNKDLTKKVLGGKKPPPYDPAGRPDELKQLAEELKQKAKEDKFKLAKEEIDDVLSYALFPQVALKYFSNRDNPDAFEPKPVESPEDMEGADMTATGATSVDAGVYKVKVKNKEYVVEVTADATSVKTADEARALASSPSSPPASPSSQSSPPASPSSPPASAPAAAPGGGKVVESPLAGTVFKVVVAPGQAVKEGDVLIVLEAMKMESEVRSPWAGTVSSIHIRQGDSVAVGAMLVSIEPS